MNLHSLYVNAYSKVVDKVGAAPIKGVRSTQGGAATPPRALRHSQHHGVGHSLTSLRLMRLVISWGPIAWHPEGKDPWPRAGPQAAQYSFSRILVMQFKYVSGFCGLKGH